MKKVLIAEDDPNLAKYLLTVLSYLKCETEVVNNGKKAISKGATFQPHVALLGVVMPEMGGVEAAIELPRVSTATKVVFISESVPEATLAHLKSQGYNFRTLGAPFTLEELREAIFGDLGEDRRAE